jgi:hypothetical protein
MKTLDELHAKLDAMLESDGRVMAIGNALGDLQSFLNLEIPRSVNMHTGWAAAPHSAQPKTLAVAPSA